MEAQKIVAAVAESELDPQVEALLGYDAEAVAQRLETEITPVDRAAWSKGDPRTWALDSFLVGRRTAYTLNTPATCEDGGGAMSLPPDDQGRAKAAAELQQEKAGVRLATLLNHALGGQGRLRPPRPAARPRP